MEKSLFSKFILLLLFVPMIFWGCEKNHFKSFKIGETTGDNVVSRTNVASCVHPNTAGPTKCEVDIDEDGNIDLVFTHRQDNGTNVTSIKGPSGLSIAIDSVKTGQNKIWVREFEADEELNSDIYWFTLSSNVNGLIFNDPDANGSGFYGFRWGTNTQRRYGYITLRSAGGIDYFVDNAAYQQFDPKDD